MVRITPEIVLQAYAHGLFPMAEDRDDPELFWVDPEQRGILPLDAFHVPRRLARTVRADRCAVTCDRDFAAVIDACAAATPGRPRTWINSEIRQLYTALHQAGHVHSVEVWAADQLVGGLYGVSLGGAFFGETMFSRARDASKIALVHLVARLRGGRYRLLDAQFTTEHLTQFGAREVPRFRYRRMLAEALTADADFHHLPDTLSGAEALSLLPAAGGPGGPA